MMTPQDIVQMADVIAAAVVRRMKPSDDNITKRQAFEEFGRKFIERHTAPLGPLRPIRIGKAKNSPIYYSRLEIAGLIEYQRQQRQEARRLINQ